MTATDAANTTTPRQRAIDILRALREKLQTTLPRWVLLSVGLACIGYSQYLVEHRQALGTPNPTAKLWNELYRLEIINYDNVFLALPFFLAGAILCALTLTPNAWKQNFVNWAATWPSMADAKWKSALSSALVGLLLFSYMLFQLSKHRYLGVYLVIWIVVIFLFTRIFWKWDRNASLDLSIGFSSADLLWLTVLLLLGFGISAFALNDIPVVMVPDEGNFWETARAIALGDLHPVFFDSGVYTFPIASSLFQGWVLRLFGITFWSWRFASVIAGVVAVIPLYLLAKEWFGRTAAVVACVMMVANPYFISFNRMGYNNSQSLFPVALCIYFFALGARKGSYFYLWLAGLTAGFGFYTYFSAWLGVVTLCLGVAYLWIVREVRFRRALAILGIILAAWGVMFLPRLVYTASGEHSEGLVFKIFETSFVNAFYGRAYYGDADLTSVSPFITLENGNVLFYNPEIYSDLLLRSTVRSIVALFDPFIVAEHFLNTGLAGVITPVFLLAGLAVGLRRFKQLRFGLPLLWFAAGMLLLSIIGTFPPRHTHLVAVIPVLALISAAGLTALSESLRELISARWEWAKGLVVLLLVGGAMIAIAYFGFQRYFVSMPNVYPPPFEDVTSWLAWKIQRPVHMIYLSDTERPHRVQYLVNTHISPHTYTAGVIDQFVPENNIVPKVPTIIFLDTLRTAGISLIENPPAGFREPVQYFHHDGFSFGYALTNTDIDLNPKTGLADGWNSLLNTPFRSLLIAFIIPLLIGLLWGLRDASSWPREDIVFEIGTDPSKRETGGQAEGSATGNFEFHLHLRIPARKK